MADFNPALPVPGKWSIFQNDADDKYNPNGKSLRLQIPVESVVAFGQHLVNCLDDPKKQKEMTVWDYEAKERKTVPCLTVYFKAKDGQFDDDGWFGNINPPAFKAEATQPVSDDIPF